MNRDDELATDIHCAILSVKKAYVSENEIAQAYKNIGCGTLHKDVGPVRTIAAFLQQYPKLFAKQGMGWRAIPLGNQADQINVMKSSKSKPMGSRTQGMKRNVFNERNGISSMHRLRQRTTFERTPRPEFVNNGRFVTKATGQRSVSPIKTFKREPIKNQGPLLRQRTPSPASSLSSVDSDDYVVPTDINMYSDIKQEVNRTTEMLDRVQVTPSFDNLNLKKLESVGKQISKILRQYKDPISFDQLLMEIRTWGIETECTDTKHLADLLRDITMKIPNASVFQIDYNKKTICRKCVEKSGDSLTRSSSQMEFASRSKPSSSNRTESLDGDDELSKYSPMPFCGSFRRQPTFKTTCPIVRIVNYVSYRMPFFAQLEDDRKELEKLESDIDRSVRKYESMTKSRRLEANKWKRGCSCLVFTDIVNRENKTKLWYRGIFLKEEDELARVLLVDYGMKPAVTFDSMIPLLDEALNSIQGLALECKLPELDVIDEDLFDEYESNWKRTFRNRRFDIKLEILSDMSNDILTTKVFCIDELGKEKDILTEVAECLDSF